MVIYGWFMAFFFLPTLLFFVNRPSVIGVIFQEFSRFQLFNSNLHTFTIGFDERFGRASFFGLTISCG